jgi:hypothetical protein
MELAPNPGPVEAAPTSLNVPAALRAESDAVLRTIEIHRKEQLCGFMGDMTVMRGMRHGSDHMPVMVSWAQAEAIETFLAEHGFSSFGWSNARQKAA